MRELRLDQPLPGQLHGLGRARRRHHDRAAVRARGGAREHRGRSDLLEAEQAEELAEPRQGLLEHPGEGVVGRVAARDAGPAVDEHDSRVGDERVDGGADVLGLVADDAVARDDVAGVLDPLAEPLPVRVVVRGAAVTDRDDPDRDRALFGRGGVMRVGAHAVDRRYPAPP
jgi:hypothetical protein